MWVHAGQATILDKVPLKRSVLCVVCCMGGVRGPKKKGGFVCTVWGARFPVFGFFEKLTKPLVS